MVKKFHLIAAFTIPALLAVGLTSTTLISKNSPEIPSGAYTQINLDYGDVVPNEELKRNVLGQYESIILNPDFEPRDALKNNFTSNKIELKNFGYTTDDAEQVEDFVYQILTEDFIDSIAVNGDEKDYIAWVDYLESTGKYSTDVIQTFRTNKKKGQAAVYFQDNKSVVPDFIYDKKPRVSDVMFTGGDVTAFEYERTPYVEVSTRYSASYRVSDSKVIDYVLDNTDYTKKKQLTNILNSNLFDNYGENSFKINSEATFQLIKKDDTWIVIGFDLTHVFDENNYNRLP